ncbi:hypothetical protein VTN31DRAFT_4605 [Thermomyces dupontii]|uniref:uncharacterized protein n=1 Tax=Talaromyces thermophilus TaxID=28565 RepID=UPI0037431CCD
MVSEHVRTHLPKLLASRPEFDKGDFETAIKRAFEDEDKLLLQMVMDDDDPEPVISGTTVALCLADLTRGLLVSGNVGDSHIVFVEREPGTEAILRLASSSASLTFTKSKRRIVLNGSVYLRNSLHKRINQTHRRRKDALSRPVVQSTFMVEAHGLVYTSSLPLFWPTKVGEAAQADSSKEP